MKMMRTDEAWMVRGQCGGDDRMATSAAIPAGGADDYQPPRKRETGTASTDPDKVLAHGIDTIVFTMDVRWGSTQTDAKGHMRPFTWFEVLKGLKAEAKTAGKNVPGVVRHETGDWLFEMQGWGSNGYEWMLNSPEMTWKVGNWLEPTSRPSMMVEVRAETLWTVGVYAAVDRCRRLVEHVGGHIVDIKVNRLDVCMDVMIDDDQFQPGEIDAGMVCRANNASHWFVRRRLTGVGIGGPTSELKARLYDKPEEIKVSGKHWMYAAWGMEGPDDIPEGKRIIRVEFQMRREKLKELGYGDLSDVLERIPDLWDYLTKRWLRMADDASKHHTMQTVRPWWAMVQAAYTRGSRICPVIPAKAVKASERQMMAQILGVFTSLLALTDQESDPESGMDHIQIGMALDIVRDHAEDRGLDGRELAHVVRQKVAKHRRLSRKWLESLERTQAMKQQARRIARIPRPEPGDGSGS